MKNITGSRPFAKVASGWRKPEDQEGHIEDGQATGLHDDNF